MKSIAKSLEDRIVDEMRALDTGVRVSGLLEVAEDGEVKKDDVTELRVRVYGLQQPVDSLPTFRVSAEIRLSVEQAETASGRVFVEAHEKVALWLKQLIVGDGCVALETDEAYAAGVQAQGGDTDFDTTVGVWYGIWNFTITGRIKA